MTRAPYESAAAPKSHSAADPVEFNVVCRSKSNLPNRTDSNAALLPYLTHQLGSAHEWSRLEPRVGVIGPRRPMRRPWKLGTTTRLSAFFGQESRLVCVQLTYKDVDRFRKGSVLELCCLKGR